MQNKRFNYNDFLNKGEDTALNHVKSNRKKSGESSKNLTQNRVSHYKRLSVMFARRSGAWFKNTLFVAAVMRLPWELNLKQLQMFRHFFYSIAAYMINRNLDFYQNFFRLRLI